MSMVKQLDIHEMLIQGTARAQQTHTDVLVSHITPVKWINPLAFFAKSAKRFAGERNFWSDPARDLVLVGAGVTRFFQGNGKGHVAKVEGEWKNLLGSCIRDDQRHIAGTGPLLLGGFSFDPLSQRTPLWDGFSDASMVLPRFLLTVTKTECYLTINVVVQSGEDPFVLMKELEQEKNSLLDADPVFPKEPPSFSLEEVEPEEWKASVMKAASEIRKGVLDKVVLAREIRLSSQNSFVPDGILKNLWDQQPDSFLFAVERGKSCFLGASPERLVKCRGEEYISASLAGTTRRGSTPEEDEELGRELLQDPKNRVEHEVVVDMVREAFLAECDDVRIPRAPRLYKTRFVQHLYTPVTGRAKPETSLLSMVERLHPTPALGGYPKEQSVAKIREMERMDRGWYAGPVGWLDSQGDGEFFVAIRSGLLKNKTASLFAGCGIVGKSDPDSEYEETKMKFRPMLSALGGMEP
ncbi:isochorismate synthase [Kroppenstedtia pulmonis]|uniref:isochorismate synthase n=2 Tax=Kroppenstedtia pulmonis TaxID=1380685 RepID=A0A7D3XZR9_9BACL|nr:isochorismate synthase [Kroppenstedtia pulmonis]